MRNGGDGSYALYQMRYARGAVVAGTRLAAFWRRFTPGKSRFARCAIIARSGDFLGLHYAQSS